MMRVMTFNICRDDAHERVTSLAWANRQERVLRLIEDVQPDVLCLQECRDLEGHSFDTFLLLLRSRCFFLQGIQRHHDASNPRLRVCTLWNAIKLKHVGTQTCWLNPSVYEPRVAHEWGQKCPRPLGNDIFQWNGCCYDPAPSTLSVWNTHLGHGRRERDASVLLLHQLVVQQMNVTHALLLMDGNLFHQSNGAHQRQTLCSNDVVDVSSLAQYVIPPVDPVTPRGTFVGSSIDRHCPRLGTVGDALDLIVGVHVRTCGTWIWNKTMLESGEPEFLANHDVFPSDHLPVVADIELI
jgi:mRNA deadenylase 3'-5' endonuclease subunit Ccr4